MPYIALKPCHFDKAYCIGEIIEDEVVNPAREKFLVEELNLIAKIQVPPQEQNNDLNGANDDGNTITTPDEKPENEVNIAAFKAHSKAELIEIAENLGINVSGLKKDEIVEAIVLSQTMEDIEDAEEGE